MKASSTTLVYSRIREFLRGFFVIVLVATADPISAKPASDKIEFHQTGRTQVYSKTLALFHDQKRKLAYAPHFQTSLAHDSQKAHTAFLNHRNRSLYLTNPVRIVHKKLPEAPEDPSSRLSR